MSGRGTSRGGGGGGRAGGGGARSGGGGGGARGGGQSSGGGRGGGPPIRGRGGGPPSRGGGGGGSSRDGGGGQSYGGGGGGDYGRGGRGGGFSARGGDRGGGSSFGRFGREGGGRTSAPDHSNLTQVLTNILPATVTQSFEFFLYGTDSQDKHEKQIESRGTRADLFNQGFWDGVLKNKTQQEKTDLRRFVYFAGSFFFSARPIEGLEKSKLPLRIVDGTNSDGATMTVVNVIRYKAPKELQMEESPVESMTGSMKSIAIDPTRCSFCSKTFTSKEGVMQHCEQTGHTPLYVGMGDNDAVEATPEVFLSFVNLALDRAMCERLLRWGREYYDRSQPMEAKDRNGIPLGVNIFEAISLSFGLLRPNGAKVPRLALTIDLRAKVIRSKSVLDSMYEDRKNPNAPYSESEKKFLRNKWIGEILIYKQDKKCYTLIDLDFDHSAVTLPVPTKNISHAEYFKQKGIVLEYPDEMPMIVVEGRHKQRIFLPPELVAGNELDPRVREMLPIVASFKPDVRNKALEKIKTFLIPGTQTSTGGTLLPAIGIILEQNRLMAKAQVLTLPDLIAAGTKIPQKNGENWAPLLSQANFNINPSHVTKLNVVIFHHRDLARGVDAVYSKIKKFVNNYNTLYRFKDDPPKVVQVGDNEQHWGTVEKEFASLQMDNLFVLDFCKPRGGSDPAYPVVKHMLTSNGYLSQFINFKTCDHAQPRDERAEKKSTMILQGVARQILQKSGARLWWVEIPKSLPLPAVFVGIDVFHAPVVYDPKTKQKGRKNSVAAIIIEVIRKGGQNTSIELYSKTFCREGGKEYFLHNEISSTLQEAMSEMKVKPGCVIIWRDGMPETAYLHAQEEIDGIRKGIRTDIVGASATPQVPTPIAYIVCQKRINTKFLTADGNYGAPSGTQVTSLQGVDGYTTFYINGRAPPFSTPKPVRFICMQRDAGLKAVPIAQLTWDQCHSYPNWTGPIKVPSVCQKAHKLAELAGAFIDGGEKINCKKFRNRPHFL